MLRFIVAVWLLLAPSLSFAQEGLIAFAAAQAPEAGLGTCFGLDASAIECAEYECMEMSGLGIEDCHANIYCFPSYWVADIFMQHAEGPHWHQFICGWYDRAQLEAAIEIACMPDYLIECTAVRIWNPDGEEQLGLVE
ncbi:MAG: hypothetical protein WEB63_09930 [Cucumibacter sp.]